MSDDVVLQAQGLGRRYGRSWVLHGVDLTVGKGESMAIVGANGAGKSTLLSILATLRRPSHGSVTLFGEDALRRPQRVRDRLGYLGHETFLDDALSARENLRFYADLFSVPDADPRVDTALQDCGLAHRADDRVAGFSRGMRQRLSLARALLHDPLLLLLDEPFSGLDAPGARDLADRLAAERERGRSMLVVSHQFHRVHAWCDRVFVLHRGQPHEDTPAATRSADEWVAHLALVAEDRA